MKKSDLDEFSRQLLLLYRAARELPVEHFQDRALNLLQSVLPFDSLLWGTGIAAPEGVDTHSMYLHNQPQDLMASYERVKHLDTSAQKLFSANGGVVAFNSRKLFRRQAEAPILDWAIRAKAENALVAAKFDPGREGFVQWISAYRADATRQFDRGEQRTAQKFIPHLFEALAINRVTHLEHLRDQNSAGRHCFAIADRRGLLYHSEEAFSKLLLEEYRDGIDRHLRADVMDSLLRSGCFIGRAAIFEIEKDKGLLFLKARRRVAADCLSRKELRVANEFAQGKSHKEVARLLCLAPSTVRTHIQRIYGKLQCRNRVTLIDLLAQAS